MILKKLIFLCLIASNVIAAQNEQFSLIGKTADFDDGTYLYFRDLVNGGDIDSAVVRNNRFHFATELPEPTLFVMLHTRDKAHFTQLWLEESPMTFDATEGDFKNAEVSGSRNQDLARTKKAEVYANVMEISQDSLKQREAEFISRHPDALISAYVLDMAIKRMTQNEIAALYSKLSQEVQTSSLGQRIAEHLEVDIPELGERFSDYSIPDSEGEIRRISDLRGKLTLLQFWSSTCPISREMNKTTLAETYSDYHSAGLEIINISNDANKEDWLNAIEEDNLNWPQLSNLQGWDGKAFKGYGINGTPSNYLIDRKGIIIARNLRGDELKEKIKEELTD